MPDFFVDTRSPGTVQPAPETGSVYVPEGLPLCLLFSFQSLCCRRVERDTSEMQDTWDGTLFLPELGVFVPIRERGSVW